MEMENKIIQVREVFCETIQLRMVNTNCETIIRYYIIYIPITSLCAKILPLAWVVYENAAKNQERPLKCKFSR